MPLNSPKSIILNLLVLGFFAVQISIIPNSVSTFAQTRIDELQSENLKISPIDRRSAEFWGLTSDEWTRHQEYRKIHRGLVSNEISPLEVLGIFEDDKTTRRRYAREFAKRQLEVLKRISEFEADYMDAITEIARQKDDENLNRWTLIASIDCAFGDCLARIQQAILYARSGEHVDAYILHASNDQEIRYWAARNEIPPTLVRDRVFTLNYALTGMVEGLTKRSIRPSE